MKLASLAMALTLVIAAPAPAAAAEAQEISVESLAGLLRMPTDSLRTILGTPSGLTLEARAEHDFTRATQRLASENVALERVGHNLRLTYRPAQVPARFTRVKSNRCARSTAEVCTTVYQPEPGAVRVGDASTASATP
ncbi:hypothetical protein HIV01_003625 [Lysobacter arenosi]|jgi:hypothetical protein|uniref:Secretin/TonB short N-terminal domain-containing protein n=1 Tax=Lysobacter arenosi TaxID=2795387 RepID=A0ABX7RDX0_9GAMM|nr:hypothetical protein [Lysobacter arenosi]QSX75631.1 hypothetical protein HIV01_003625 [Lysobacter arenosi]